MYIFGTICEMYRHHQKILSIKHTLKKSKQQTGKLLLKQFPVITICVISVDICTEIISLVRNKKKYFLLHNFEYFQDQHRYETSKF